MIRNFQGIEEEQALRSLDIYGYAILRNAIEPEIVEKLKDLVVSYYIPIDEPERLGLPSRDARDAMVYNLQNKNKIFIDLAASSALEHILKAKLNDPYYRFLEPEYPNYILGYYNARSSGSALDLHIDSYIPAYGEKTWSMQVAFVLDRTMEENGCTVVVPGSHKSGRYTDRKLESTTPLLAEAGDILLWDSRLWHGTTENITGAARWVLIATFSCWWVKPSMDMTRSLSQETFAQLTDKQKLLLGFCSIPPKDEHDRIATKAGYSSLRKSVDDYAR